MPVTGTPAAVRVGPGKLLIAPLGTAAPTDLTTAWNAAFVELGYTTEGSSFVFDQTFEDVNVAEEYDPVQTLQTARSITVNFAAAQLTASNMQKAFNGGTVTTTAANGTSVLQSYVTFEPAAAGVFTPVMIGWEADDGYERWVFRKCVQAGSVEVARRRAPDAANIPMSFRVNKPDSGAIFTFIHDANYTSAA